MTKQLLDFCYHASDVVEKGDSGRVYRLYFILDSFQMHCAGFRITTRIVGENLKNFTFKSDDLISADRIYMYVRWHETVYQKRGKLCYEAAE